MGDLFIWFIYLKIGITGWASLWSVYEYSISIFWKSPLGLPSPASWTIGHSQFITSRGVQKLQEVQELQELTFSVGQDRQQGAAVITSRGLQELQELDELISDILGNMQI